jgi:hypothetical protein
VGPILLLAHVNQKFFFFFLFFGNEAFWLKPSLWRRKLEADKKKKKKNTKNRKKEKKIFCVVCVGGG